jgi:pyridoxamine 5'-phosphate oxidase
MDKTEIFKYLNEARIFFLATTEGDTPHVRGIFLHKADEKGISFTTGKFRDLYKQLKANPKVELCFSREKSSIRVSGTVVELDDDIDLKKEIVEARPFMKPWIDAKGFAPMAVFRVVDCVATTWSFDKTLEPKTFVPLS